MQLILDSNDFLYEALVDLAEVAEVPLEYAFRAAIHNLVDHANSEFIANPRDARFREQTQEEGDAAFMAAASPPEECERQIRELIREKGTDLSKEAKESIVRNTLELNAAALEMKAAYERIVDGSDGMTIH